MRHALTTLLLSAGAAAAQPTPPTPVVYHEVLGAVAAGPPVAYVPPAPVSYNSPPARTAWLPPQSRTRGGYWWVTNRMGGVPWYDAQTARGFVPSQPARSALRRLGLFR